MSRESSDGGLVRWDSGDAPICGVQTSVEDGGRSALVHFDNSENLKFAWPSDALTPVLLEVGQPVQLVATGDRGVVTNRAEGRGRIFYSVALTSGDNRTV